MTGEQPMWGTPDQLFARVEKSRQQFLADWTFWLVSCQPSHETVIPECDGTHKAMTSIAELTLIPTVVKEAGR
jgi:hypothetical protein